MRTRNNQAGFSVIEFVLVLAVLGVLGFVGYTVYNKHQTTTPATTTASTQATTSDNVASAPAINSTSDLDKAAATLDQTDPSGSNSTDSSSLDSQLAAF